MGEKNNKNKIDVEAMRKYIKEINDDDLRAMFGTTLSTSILKKGEEEKVFEKLTEYSKYIVPVNLGHIIMIDNKRYIVTCLYTDNTVDLLSDLQAKKNVGLYGKEIEIIGKLEVIEEE